MGGWACGVAGRSWGWQRMLLCGTISCARDLEGGWLLPLPLEAIGFFCAGWGQRRLLWGQPGPCLPSLALSLGVSVSSLARAQTHSGHCQAGRGPEGQGGLWEGPRYQDTGA